MARVLPSLSVWPGTSSLNKLYLTAKGIYSMRGVDSSGSVNYGNDIFKAYDSRTALDKYGLTPGERVNGIYLNLNAAFELRPNIFLEAGATHLRRKYESGLQLPLLYLFLRRPALEYFP